MPEAVPAPVRALIRERLQALEQLEILLLMQNDSSHAWTPAELAASLQLSEITAEAALAHLTHHRLIAQLGRRAEFRYAPVDATVAEAVATLARTYVQARAEVLALISSDAVGRVRRRARALMETLKVERKK